MLPPGSDSCVLLRPELWEDSADAAWPVGGGFHRGNR
jgi:hypothetical protein